MSAKEVQKQKKLYYVYLYALTVGGKTIAKYAGRHCFTPKDESERFDLRYRGSGDCWKHLLEIFGFTEGCTWEKSDGEGEYVFVGENYTRFIAKVLGYSDSEKEIKEIEQRAIAWLVQSEGLNMKLLEEFKGGSREKGSKSFLKKYKHILSGNGVFVNLSTNRFSKTTEE